MAVTIESLLEENLGKAQELLEASESAHRDMQAIADLGDRIEGQFETSNEAAGESLRNLRNKIAALQSTFEQTEQETTAKLDVVVQQAAETEQRSTAVANEVSQHLAAAKGRVVAAESELESKLKATESQLQELFDDASQYRELVESTGQKSQQVAEDFVAKLTSSLAELEAKKESIANEYETLRANADQELQTLMQSIDNGVNDTQQKVDATLSSAKQVAESSSQKVRTKVTDDGLKSVLSDFDDFAKALDILTDTTEKLGLEFGDSLDGVIDNIEEIVALVQRIKPVLKLVDELL